MDEYFKGGGRGRSGGLGGNKCKNDEKWDMKTKKCVKKTKKEMRNSYSIQIIAFMILIFCSIYLKYWLSLFLLILVKS